MNTEKESSTKKRRIICGATGGILLIWLLIFLGGSFVSKRQRAHAILGQAENSLNVLAEKDLRAKVDRMHKSLQRLSPKGIHITVDTGRNILYLNRGDTILRETVVSCGSGNVLEDPSGQRRWIFDTPRGVFAVTSMIHNPAWIKPDWAFVEEGEPVPEDPRLRVESGVLGEYALGFGEGYFIHGTLYTRLLGRNVTHGCIRVGDDDLEAVFKSVRIGTPVYIY